MKSSVKQGKSRVSNLNCFNDEENQKYEKSQEYFFQSHMNSITLKFFNRNLERQYEQIEFKNHFAFIKKMMWIIVLVCSFANMKLLLKGVQGWKGYAYFVGWPFSTLITYLLLRWRLDKFTTIHTINMFVVISLMNWTFHDAECQKIVHSDAMSPFVRGFMFAQGAYQYITGTNFPSMAIMVLYIYFSFIFSSHQETYLQNTVSIFPYAILLIYKIYYIEKQKRITFLLQVQEKNWSNIMQKVLPTSLMILRDNEREERIELHKVNNRALKEFKANSHEQFKHLAERMYIIQDLPLNSNLNSNHTQTYLQNQKVLYKESWDNTLYAKLKKNAIILRPIFNPRPNLLAKKKQQEESLRVFRQLYQNSIEVNAATPLPQHNQQMQNKESAGGSSSIQLEKNKQNINEQNNVCQLAQSNLLLKDSDTLIENIKVLYKEEGIKDEEEAQILSIRINYFYLNDLYIAITIKNQSYKDKFKAQERETYLLQNFMRQSLNKTINLIKYPPLSSKFCKTMDSVVINQLTNSLEFIKNQGVLPSISSNQKVIKKSSFDLKNLILSIFEILTPIAKEKQIQFLLKNEDQIGTVNQDKHKVQQALMNLIYNSLIFVSIVSLILKPEKETKRKKIERSNFSFSLLYSLSNKINNMK